MPIILNARDEIRVFDDPFSSDTHFGGRNRLPCEMHVLSQCDVRSIRAHEEAERCAEPGIRIQELEHPITLVISEPDIKDSLVPDGLYEFLSVRCNRRAGKANSKRGHARIHG